MLNEYPGLRSPTQLPVESWLPTSHTSTLSSLMVMVMVHFRTGSRRTGSRETVPLLSMHALAVESVSKVTRSAIFGPVLMDVVAVVLKFGVVEVYNLHSKCLRNVCYRLAS
jgi:hypothetical protein